MKKMTPLDVIRLGDPATTAAIDATQKALRDRYDGQTQAQAGQAKAAAPATPAPAK